MRHFGGATATPTKRLFISPAMQGKFRRCRRRISVKGDQKYFVKVVALFVCFWLKLLIILA
jgi:hypothetical protein